MSTRDKCGCGRRHRRFTLAGVTVTGCPVCMAKPETQRALEELRTAALAHVDELRERTQPETQG